VTTTSVTSMAASSSRRAGISLPLSGTACWGHDHTVLVVQSGQQARHRASTAGAAQALAVDGDDPLPVDLADLGEHPGPDPGVDVVGVQGGHGAPDRGLPRAGRLRRRFPTCAAIPGPRR